MKNKIIIMISIFILLLSSILLTTKKDNNKIKLAEVTHSIFYAPMYVAIENNYFKEEGLDIDLTLVSGADKVSASVISGDSDIGFAGLEATIYTYLGGQEDYLVNFAGLTKRDGQFIVSRTKEDFNLNKLKGKEILVGRINGMPSLNFINALDNEHINKDNININYNVDYANLSSAFISGTGDYVNLFEPNATKLEKEGLGHIVASIGKYSGEMPYTTFFTKKLYLNNNKDTINKFKKAINKGLKYVQENDSTTIAKVIVNQFSDLSINELSLMIQRYKDNDTWLSNTNITKESYDNLSNLLFNNKIIDNKVDYNILVNND
ncbi:MAG: ABC transporter substrate-binding protein [Firmicutes bacterium]|nr:ABC transporter substrate-binding protein [Bacillota bacterium]